MTDLADSGDFDGDGKLTWSDSLATNTVIVEHHLNNVRKILKIPEVRSQLGSDHWEGRTAPLHLAAELGRPECAEMMIEAGALVNA